MAQLYETVLFSKDKLHKREKQGGGDARCVFPRLKITAGTCRDNVHCNTLFPAEQIGCGFPMG